MAKILKNAGYVSVALDAGQSGANIHKACTVDRPDDACMRTSFREGGRLIGSIGGGIAGGAAASYAVCTLVFALPTGGTSALWCGIVAGGAGGYLGGSYIGAGIMEFGNVLYEKTFSDRNTRP